MLEGTVSLDAAKIVVNIPNTKHSLHDEKTLIIEFHNKRILCLGNLSFVGLDVTIYLRW